VLERLRGPLIRIATHSQPSMRWAWLSRSTCCWSTI
jgi:hypothetical protein